MSYQEFLARKARVVHPAGHEVKALNPALRPDQADVVRWALRMGRAALFQDCGLGKTFEQLEWALHVPGDVLILAPLAVAAQTKREGEKFGIPVTVCRSQADVQPGINVTNYEMLQHFDASAFAGVVLDESSILKAYEGSTRNAIIDAFRDTPYRLACTATPAPNDYMELGNHAEFLGVMTRTEMLAMFFVHDGGETQKWRLKGHAEKDFWRWICSWAVMMRKPSDLGYSDDGFDLPPLNYHEHVIDMPASSAGVLFDTGSPTLIERRRARRTSSDKRCAFAADLVNRERDEQWIVWCDLNAESSTLADMIPDAVEVCGSDTREQKEKALQDFTDGRTRVIVTKPSIAGHGMNWQACARMVFVGLSDSFEALYQATRRAWRFGQTRPVEAHIVTASTEGAVLANVKRKETDHEAMFTEMVKHMSEISRETIRGHEMTRSSYAEDVRRGERWEMRLGDCVESLRGTPDASVDFSVFSPPFASLYTYTDLDRDMGNCADGEEFMAHYRFLIAELLRVLKPGRLVSMHCMNLPTSKARDGVIGIRDFRGEIIRECVAAGFIYHAEVCIWKDPVTAMQRTKALGLLHKQIRKDSSMSRQGVPDYIVTFRKPGENAEPIAHTPEEFPVGYWQQVASPVWACFDGIGADNFLRCVSPSDERRRKSPDYIEGGIDAGETLQRESAREERDERHIAPLQLEVIKRCVLLWSNPGDLVLSPFAGIGSEGYQAIQMGRRFLGIELKRAYWEQGCANLTRAEHESKQETLFGDLAAPLRARDTSEPQPSDDDSREGAVA